jgi:hypothetical protein
MKKITLFASLFACSVLLAQDFSTGTIPFSTDAGLAYSAEIATDSENVTLTLVGPSDRWLGIGFGTQAMSSGDAVVFDGTNLVDRTFVGNQQPPVDAAQTWSVISNTVNGSTRTIVGRRNLNSGQPNNYVFTNSAEPISLIWARGATASFNLANHGGNNRGVTMSQFVLSNNVFNADVFKMYPVPARNFVTLEIPNFIDNATINIYDFSGKRVLNSNVSQQNNTVGTSTLARGSYIIQLESQEYSFTRILVLE